MVVTATASGDNMSKYKDYSINGIKITKDFAKDIASVSKNIVSLIIKTSKNEAVAFEAVLGVLVQIAIVVRLPCEELIEIVKAQYNCYKVVKENKILN